MSKAQQTRLAAADKQRIQKSGYWYEALVDIAQPTEATDPIRKGAERVVREGFKCVERSVADTARASHVAICGWTLHTQGMIPRYVAEDIGVLVGHQLTEALTKAQSATTEILLPKLIIQLRVGQNAATLAKWLATERKRAGERVSEGVDIKAVAAKLRKTIEAAVKSLPLDYAVRRAALAELSDACREEVARGLEPVLNDYLASLKKESYEEKRELSTFVNAEIRRFGLAIKDDGSGKLCRLRGNTGGHVDRGRFQLEYTDEMGKQHQPTSSAELPYLALALDDLTRAPYGQRAKRSR